MTSASQFYLLGSFFILIPLLGSLVLADLDSEYSNSAYLDESRTYKLYWRIDNNRKSIQFAVRVKTLGWVGFGVGNGNMIGSDVVIGWVKENKGYLKDRFAVAEALPPIDDKQDYKLLAARESNGETIIEFSRLWNTCDEKDIEIQTGTARIIYAYHSDDPSSEDSIPKHTTRGSRSLILLDVQKQRPSLPKDVEYFDLRQNDTVLSSDDTSYLCKAFEIPQLPTKRHIVQIAPVITPGNEGTVHHILVYQCRNDFPRSNLSVVSKCYERNMPPAIKQCAGGSVIAGWAIGGGPFNFPNHTGLAIGTSDAPRYVVLEIHYDNSKKMTGIHDSSGLRFFYTSSLREYDAAMLWVGPASSSSMMIPPNQEKWLTSGYCHRNCTKNFNSPLPDKGINIFATALHSHLQGVSLWTRHVRNGKELPEIARDDHYDFNYQEFRYPDREIHVMPGDDIIQECVYQSKGKKFPVYGGISTKQEMCLGFLYYYPKVKLNQCLSINFGFHKLVRRRFRKNGTYVGYPPKEWTQEFVQDIKQSYENETRVLALCRDQNNTGLGADETMVLKPTIEQPLPKPNICPKTPTSSATTPISKIPFLLMFLIGHLPLIVKS